MCSAVLVVLFIDSVERARYSGYRRPETQMFGSFVSERKLLKIAAIRNGMCASEMLDCTFSFCAVSHEWLSLSHGKRIIA